MRKQILFYVIALSLVAKIVVAQDAPRIEIDKIIIQIPKSQKNALPTSASVFKFGNSSPSALSLSDSVNQLAGISLQMYGGLESATAVSIRGSNSQHVQIIWDGIPLDTASGKGLSLQNVPAQQIEKIQIYKTLTPLSMSQSNSSGTIALTSKPISKDWHGQWGLGLGSFTTRELFGTTTWGGQKHSFGLGVDFLSTLGNFEFLDNNGTPQNPNDDQTTTRQNNDLTNWHTQMQWAFAGHPQFVLKLKSEFFTIDKGVAGFANFQSKNARFQQYESLSSFKLQTTEAFSKSADWQNHFYTRYILTEFSDPFGEIGLGAAQQNHDTTFILGEKLQHHKQFTPSFSWDQLAHYTYESFLPVNELGTTVAGSQSLRHQLQLATQPSISLWHNSLDITGKLHWLVAVYDINNNDPSLNTSNTFAASRTETPLVAGLSLKKQLTPQLLVKSAIAREVRLPQFNELFGDQGYVLGNPELNSEKTIKFDVGPVWQTADFGFLKNLRLEVSYFSEWSTDLIEFEVINGVARADNIGKTRSQGMESFLYAEPATWLQTSLGYTFLEAKDTEADRYLIGRPKHEATFGSVVTYKQFSIQENLEWSHEKYLDSLNTQKIENRLRLDLAANCNIGKQSVLVFEIKNLTDSQIEDALGFPLPGRSFFLRYKQSW